jgi:hypothetical protein
MNTTHLFAALLTAAVLSAPALAQHGPEAQPKDSQKQHNMSDMMGKPTLEQTTAGLNIRVWVITQTVHEKMMKDHGMMGRGMKRWTSPHLLDTEKSQYLPVKEDWHGQREEAKDV